MMLLIQSHCIFFITILHLQKSESTFIPVVAFKESSGLSPIISSVECIGFKLCNASVEFNHYLDSGDSCCGSTHNGTGFISKMRLLILNSHGHILWGAIFKTSQQNESWLDTDHLVMTSDDRSIEAVDAMSYDPIPQELCFYSDANKTLTTFSVAISKAVSYYLLSRNSKGSPLPSAVEKNISLLNDLSYQPLLGSFIRKINNNYIQIVSDVPILVGRINLELLNYGSKVVTLNCEKNWKLEYNVKCCENQDTEFFTFNYTMEVNVICYGNVGITIDVESILVSCLRIYPDFDSELDFSNFESIRFSLDILGPKGSASFVHGSHLIMEEYWPSGVETDESVLTDSMTNTWESSESETNLTIRNPASDATITVVSESFKPDSTELQTIAAQNIQVSASIYLSSSIFPFWPSEGSLDTSSEKLVSEIQSTPLDVATGTIETFKQNEVKKTATASATSADDNIELLEQTTEDLPSHFSFVQSRVETTHFESNPFVTVSEITSLISLQTEPAGGGIADTVSSMVANEQESSKLFIGENPFKEEKNQNSESVDDVSVSKVENWITETNKNMFLIQTYFLGSEANVATVDTHMPTELEITKNLEQETSQTTGYVMYSSTMVHDTTTQNLPFTLKEMCCLINTDKTNAGENISKNINLTLDQCHKEIYISDSSGTPCRCHCRPKKLSGHILQEPIQQRVEKIVKELTVDKKALSSTTRKLTSAKDPRKSSRTIGAIGIALLITVGALIVSLDIPHIIDLVVAFKRKIQISSQ